MSEYWVSKKKYFCKYCDIYIADDAPSRQQHENGLRHKGNVERFIRNLYKGSEKRKKDLEEEKRDIARLELAAQAAFAQDVASGVARPTSAPVASTSAAPRKPPPRPSNPYANYSTAESLGFNDPDAERYAAEAEQRRTQGVIGEWEVVPTTAAPPLVATLEDPESGAETCGLKREAETPIADEDERHFKLRKKTLAVGLNNIYDPGAISIKLKKKKEEPEPAIQSAHEAEESLNDAAQHVPKWTKIQWKQTGENDASRNDGASQNSSPNGASDTTVKEEQRIDAASSAAKWSKIQWQAPADGTMHVPVFNSGTHDNFATKPGGQTERPTPPAPEETKPSTIKSEVVAPPLTATESTGSMFRKRKIPVGGNRGKR